MFTGIVEELGIVAAFERRPAGARLRVNCRTVVEDLREGASIAVYGVCLTAVDVTGIPGVAVGDEVTIIGETASRKITAWEHAQHAATIPYEILCNISGRLPRNYLG